MSKNKLCSLPLLIRILKIQQSPKWLKIFVCGTQRTWFGWYLIVHTFVHTYSWHATCITHWFDCVALLTKTCRPVGLSPKRPYIVVIPVPEITLVRDRGKTVPNGVTQQRPPGDKPATPHSPVWRHIIAQYDFFRNCPALVVVPAFSAQAYPLALYTAVFVGESGFNRRVKQLTQ